MSQNIMLLQHQKKFIKKMKMKSNTILKTNTILTILKFKHTRNHSNCFKGSKYTKCPEG